MGRITNLKKRLKDQNIEDVELTEMKHAIRVNGVIDMWRIQYMAFVIPENKYLHFENSEKLVDFVFENFGKYEKRPPYKRTAKGNIGYKEFKNNMQKPVAMAEHNFWGCCRETSKDHLYFISNGIGHVKIGRSAKPEKRLAELQTASPTKLELLFVGKNKGLLEKKMHEAFAELALHGEWYQLTERIEDFIAFAKSHVREERKDMEEQYFINPIENPIRLTKHVEQLSGDSLMPFGKFRGKHVSSLPAWYLVWFYDQGEDTPLNQYIEENFSTIMAEYKASKKSGHVRDNKAFR